MPALSADSISCLVFADARKDDFLRIAAGFERAKQLAAGNDIEAASLLGERPQQRQVGIGLDGKTHDVRHSGKSLIEDLEVALERRQAVHVGRRADFPGDALERHFLGEHFAAAVFEMVHGSPRTNFYFVGRRAQGAVEQLRRDPVAVNRLGPHFLIIVAVLFFLRELAPVFHVDRGQRAVGHRTVRTTLGNFLAENHKARQVLERACRRRTPSAGPR